MAATRDKMAAARPCSHAVLNSDVSGNNVTVNLRQPNSRRHNGLRINSDGLDDEFVENVFYGVSLQEANPVRYMN